MALLFFSLLSFCLYAVLSHYLLLRRMKKHTTAIISSVMDSEWAILISHNAPDLYETMLRVLTMGEHAT